ncbi:Homeobox protein tos8 [Stygiomarasmius scandens]|uniref:Homeobox protein tos8 n=1 Tax=Marasmiellus scandens TaxID=2682957 RepID=A0ABR1IPX7_9AGAR
MRCQKRSLECVFPAESRRGIRKKKIPRRGYILSAEVPEFNQSESPSGTMGSSVSVPWQISGPSHLPATASSSLVRFDSPIARELPKNIDYIEAWLQSHSDHPYPTEEETQELCYDTGLSASQVSDWMMNASYFARRRLQLQTVDSTEDREPPANINETPRTRSTRKRKASPAIEPDAPAPVKRGRGRPKGISRNNESTIMSTINKTKKTKSTRKLKTSSAYEPNASALVKRGQRRPKQISSNDESTVMSISRKGKRLAAAFDTPSVPGKRGRPPKPKAAEESGTEEPVQKRKRGRPPKAKPANAADSDSKVSESFRSVFPGKIAHIVTSSFWNDTQLVRAWEEYRQRQGL